MSQTLALELPISKLPIAKSARIVSWRRQKFGMIGQSGIGKSEFWAQGEKSFFVECEAGLNHLEVLKLPCRSWEGFREIYRLLLEGQKSGELPYDTIVIDTIDRLIDYAHEEIVQRGRERYQKIEINTIGDIPNGAGWFWTKELISNALGKLEDLGTAVVYIGHLATKKEKISPIFEIDRRTISVGGQLGEALCAWPDHLLHVESIILGQELKRRVRTFPTQSIEAKSRGGIVPDGIQWSNNAKENYENLKKLFQE